MLALTITHAHTHTHHRTFNNICYLDVNSRESDQRFSPEETTCNLPKVWQRILLNIKTIFQFLTVSLATRGGVQKKSHELRSATLTVANGTSSKTLWMQASFAPAQGPASLRPSRKQPILGNLGQGPTLGTSKSENVFINSSASQPRPRELCSLSSLKPAISGSCALNITCPEALIIIVQAQCPYKIRYVLTGPISLGILGMILRNKQFNAQRNHNLGGHTTVGLGGPPGGLRVFAGLCAQCSLL